jgi:4-hydroxybenzoate polyprenyltransferase
MGQGSYFYSHVFEKSMQKILELFKISRPRFWIYGLGPYLLGIAHLIQKGLVTADHIWLIIVFGVFFTFPANLLVYGVNDIFDRDTDAQNPKKQEYESRLSEQNIPFLLRGIIISILPFFVLTLFFLPFISICLFIGAILALVMYSTPPFRFKSVPVIDSLWNGLMSISGFLVVISFFETSIPWIGLIAGFLWASGMHAYSAVPDIAYDTSVHIRTIATWLGARKTLLATLFAMITATALVVVTGGWLIGLLGIPFIVLISLTYKNPKSIMRYYKIFPFVTSLVGMILFFVILL